LLLLLLLLQATQTLFQNEAEQGWGALFPTDPQRIADKLAKLALSRNPPRHYIDGWLSSFLYCLGCYAPCWVLDLAQAFRLRLPPLFSRLDS
jgi:hypothetical protein